MNRREYIKQSFKLTDEELDNFERFMDNHKCITPKQRLQYIEEDVAPQHYSIEWHENSIGSWIIAKCEICGKTKDISGKERRNY